MKATIRFTVNADVAIATCTGTLGGPEARQGVKDFWEAPGWSGQSVVWDFREANFDLSSPETRQLAQFVLENQPTPPPRVAFVTGSDVDFGMSRVFEAYREDPQTEFRVFREYDEAVSWARESAAGRLGFAWRSRKNQDVEILRDGRPVSTLRGTEAAKFLAKVQRASEPEAQQVMARVTGNYRRGNERVAGKHPRNHRS
ncbi:MAG: hypothetical protein DHS20C21_16530 [Gemmatimonadota bacterium]|nr:MAG: hypothetical protein DHS20C21_16530 [Gemmatimonadota bacterium]